MDKKFNSFLLILGIIFTLITGLFQFFINIHLFNLKKYGGSWKLLLCVLYHHCTGMPLDRQYD